MKWIESLIKTTAISVFLGDASLNIKKSVSRKRTTLLVILWGNVKLSSVTKVKELCEFGKIAIFLVLFQQKVIITIIHLSKKLTIMGIFAKAIKGWDKPIKSYPWKTARVEEDLPYSIIRACDQANSSGWMEKIFQSISWSGGKSSRRRIGSSTHGGRSQGHGYRTEGVRRKEREESISQSSMKCESFRYNLKPLTVLFCFPISVIFPSVFIVLFFHSCFYSVC